MITRNTQITSRYPLAFYSTALAVYYADQHRSWSSSERWHGIRHPNQHCTDIDKQHLTLYCTPLTSARRMCICQLRRLRVFMSCAHRLHWDLPI